MNMEKVIKGLEYCEEYFNCCDKCPYWDGGTHCAADLAHDALALLKEQELPTELKQKMWNAFYAEEDEYEKKLVGTDKHHEWFSTYRPWLQKGFDIAINAIADWEGR